MACGICGAVEPCYLRARTFSSDGHQFTRPWPFISKIRYGAYLCSQCYEEADNLYTIIHEIEAEIKSLKVSAEELQYVKKSKEKVDSRVGFLSDFVSAFKEGVAPDILLKPGDGGSPIPAHTTLMKSRSEIFRNMLEADGSKLQPAGGTLTLSELTSEELRSFVEFLYSGTLAQEKLQEHVYALFVAAHKYNIPYLYEFCENHMLSFLSASNALDVLSVADSCSNKTLKDAAMDWILANMEDVVNSEKYDAFSTKHSSLCLQITKAYFGCRRGRKE